MLLLLSEPLLVFVVNLALLALESYEVHLLYLRFLDLQI